MPRRRRLQRQPRPFYEIKSDYVPFVRTKSDIVWQLKFSVDPTTQIIWEFWPGFPLECTVFLRRLSGAVRSHHIRYIRSDPETFGPSGKIGALKARVLEAASVVSFYVETAGPSTPGQITHDRAHSECCRPRRDAQHFLRRRCRGAARPFSGNPSTVQRMDFRLKAPALRCKVSAHD